MGKPKHRWQMMSIHFVQSSTARFEMQFHDGMVFFLLQDVFFELIIWSSHNIQIAPETSMSLKSVQASFASTSSALFLHPVPNKPLKSQQTFCWHWKPDLEERTDLSAIEELFKLCEGNVAGGTTTSILLQHVEDRHEHLNLPNHSRNLAGEKIVLDFSSPISFSEKHYGSMRCQGRPAVVCYSSQFGCASLDPVLHFQWQTGKTSRLHLDALPEPQNRKKCPT